MSGRLRFRAVTPDRTVLEQEADFVILRTAQGDKGILPGHEACVVELAEGFLKLFEGKKETGSLVVLGGFAMVGDNSLTVLTPLAERPERIEELLAGRERQRAEKQQLEERSDLEIHRVESALRRMLVLNDVSAYAVLQGRGGREDSDEE